MDNSHEYGYDEFEPLVRDLLPHFKLANLSKMWKPAFFQRTEVPRTNIASQKTIYWGDGLGLQEFFSPSHKWFGREMCPPDNKWEDGSPSFMAPISHYHLLQTETFHVESGSGLWYLHGRAIQLNKGDEITIPRCRPHRFENVPGSTEPLVVLYRYDAQRWEMEERFFRNTLQYFDDCRKCKIAPSLLQICVFLSDAWMPGDFIPCPGGDYVRCFVNTVFMWVLAFAGRYVYGYQGSYIEYYDPEISKRHMMENSKKER